MFLSRKKSSKQIGFFLVGCFLCASIAVAKAETMIDATAIPFEELLQKEYIPASHVANQVSNAASAVSIVTARDIKEYGYRTLGEILASMRGLHTSQGYEYTYLSGRGYSAPGEYAGRIAVLIDGYRADDSIFGQTYLSDDGILDVAMIERIEYIPGGSSAGYSNGALLGAINIITKDVTDIDGIQMALACGSHNTTSMRAAFAQKFDNDLELMFNASKMKTDGRDYSYLEDGIKIDEKGHAARENHRFFLKTSYKNFSFESGWVKHSKEVPSYAYSLLMMDEQIQQSDKNGFARLKYDEDIATDVKLSTSAWYGEYTYTIDDPVWFSEENLLYEGHIQARWFGGDVKLIATAWENHIVSLGMEYKSDDKATWSDNIFDVSTDELIDTWFLDYGDRKTYSLYMYDNFTITPSLDMNYGFRYERGDNGYHGLSPQIALLYEASKSTLVKFSVGETNRQSVLYEGESTSPEKARTVEVVLEENFDKKTKFLASAYSYQIVDRIAMVEISDIHVYGLEFEFEKHWINSTRLRASYAYQKAYEEDTKRTLVNSPRHLAKLNLSLPLYRDYLRMALETHYVGKRPLFTESSDMYASDYLRSNLTFISYDLVEELEILLSVKNITNENYEDVIFPQMNGDLTYPQDGRTFWFEVGYKF